jgi:Cu(I)/Ag(I) efflux system membrane protein CusA/SilA
MPILSQHGSIAEALDILSAQDAAMRSLPEVSMVVGKIGRVDSPLDPAPLTMIETLVVYKPEYREVDGKIVRQWRDHIRSPDDIWEELVRVAKIPGANVPSKGYPIQIRQVMLQTGMTANMGVKVFGPSLEAIGAVADEVGKVLADVDVVVSESINVNRVVGKPYLLIDTTGEDVRQRIYHHGLNVKDVLDVVQAAIGGRRVTTTIDGQQRYAVRVRYPRERRDTLAAMEAILIPTPAGQQVPLAELANFTYVHGPQMIQSENARKVAYVTFDTADGVSEVAAAQTVQAALDSAAETRRLRLPAGVSYLLDGQFRNEQRANRRLMLLIPLALSVMFLLLYLQFRSLGLAVLIFTGVAVAFSGGFLLLGLYGQAWFLDVDLGGQSLRELFQVGPVSLSTAIWVGFLALFGIATDDGVVMGTYLQQVFASRQPSKVDEVRRAVIAAGSRRVRACLMTTATTLLALLPVLTSTGRGSDIMAPMAIPIFGGMAIEVLTMLVVPVLYSLVQERRLT